VGGPEEVERALWRLARELQERHPGGELVTLCGIATRGVHLAARLAGLVEAQGGGRWLAVALDTGPFRDDSPRASRADVQGDAPLPPADRAAIDQRVVVLVDDVLFHGRTARAALVALAGLGRPLAVELLVLVDRGHRELPLRATYVGRNLPTRVDERVRVRLRECDGEDSITLLREEPG
jgi:pyrimidine operon attenuation protein/uracil phosphoribosyltransferase